MCSLSSKAEILRKLDPLFISTTDPRGKFDGAENEKKKKKEEKKRKIITQNI